MILHHTNTNNLAASLTATSGTGNAFSQSKVINALTHSARKPSTSASNCEIRYSDFMYNIVLYSNYE